MSLNHYRDESHRESKLRGWWNGIRRSNPLAAPAKICLIHSELSEAMEGLRKDKMDDHLPNRPAAEVELADALIRIFDLAGWLNYDLEGAYQEKMNYNRTREDHDIANREKAFGKKF